MLRKCAVRRPSREPSAPSSPSPAERPRVGCGALARVFVLSSGWLHPQSSALTGCPLPTGAAGRSPALPPGVHPQLEEEAVLGPLLWGGALNTWGRLDCPLEEIQARGCRSVPFSRTGSGRPGLGSWSQREGPRPQAACPDHYRGPARDVPTRATEALPRCHPAPPFTLCLLPKVGSSTEPWGG